MNPLGVNGIDVKQLQQKQADGEAFILLDVREPMELQVASLGDAAISAPLSQLAQVGPEALPEAARDKSAEIIVMCHHGGRSAQVVSWLTQQGWTNVTNLDGGIHAWSMMVDPSVPTY